ncbi:MAG: HEAT repeat domain-containing protein [Planctomycetes bacterium]|nr:HEAT repeat domain-containing protein [Planctomycetota bacterium]
MTKTIAQNLTHILFLALVAAAGCDGPEGSGLAWSQDDKSPTTRDSKEQDLRRAISNLKSGSVGERSLAAAELGNGGDPRAVEPLAAAVKHPDANVRHAVILALAGLADSLGSQAMAPAVGAIQSAAEDPNEGIRIEARTLLKKIRGQ